MREISRLCSEKAVSGKHETKPRPMAKGQVEGGNALRAARAAEIDAASHRPTAAQKQQQIAELEERAVLFGDPVGRTGDCVPGAAGCWDAPTKRPRVHCTL